MLNHMVSLAQMQVNMTSRNFFLNSKVGSDLLLAAAGEKVSKQLSCQTFSRKQYLSVFVQYFLFILSWRMNNLSKLLFLELLCFPTQTGGYTNANYIWDLMQARKAVPSLPAVEAYYNGLKVSLLTSCAIICQSISCLSLFIISYLQVV